MQYFFIMERFESSSYVDQGFPDLCLFDSSSWFEVLIDEFHQISPFGELHHNA